MPWASRRRSPLFRTRRTRRFTRCRTGWTRSRDEERCAAVQRLSYLRNLVGCCGERGLLGLAFAPDYAASRRFFVNYTNMNGDTVVARYKRSAGDPLVADPTSRFDLRWTSIAGSPPYIEHSPEFGNHNGGNLAFGPDGYLYIGMGDGGSGDDPNNRGQSPDTLLAKMLRIDVSVPDGDVSGYRVPADNPFVGGSPVAALPEIWDFGVRKPWRFSFDVGWGARGPS